MPFQNFVSNPISYSEWHAHASNEYRCLNAVNRNINRNTKAADVHSKVLPGFENNLIKVF